MDRKRIALEQLFPRASFVDCGGVVVSRACADSRAVRPGDLFVALPGTRVDGHQMATQAVQKGAQAVMVDRPLPALGVPQCVVPDTRAAWSMLTLAAAGMPHKKLQTVGITGTNGKTTTSWILRSILQAAEQTTGLLGTVEYHDGRQRELPQLTTPDAASIAAWMGRMADNRASHCVLEVSSHALDQRRCEAVSLAVAAVTNVTQDHFDYHGDFETYLTAKAGIQRLLGTQAELWLGIDDAGCREIRRRLPPHVHVRTYGFDPMANAQVRTETVTGTGTAEENWRVGRQQVLHLTLQGGSVQAASSLVGRHNALNCLAAAAMAESLGISLPAIAEGIQRLQYVPGRLQPVLQGQPFQVYVDFAHTPDGLKHCLETLRPMTSGRLICIFGAGGNRDRAKRPLMGKMAAKADEVILTSDNCRDESVHQILQHIAAGLTGHPAVRQIPDRRAAIEAGLQTAAPGDIVVIAGRGHETVQRMGHHDIPFDDFQVATELLQRIMQASAPEGASRFLPRPNGLPLAAVQSPAA